MAGIWFDDMQVGQIFDHAITRTITEADNIWFSCATMNPQPLHIDAEFAAASQFGKPLVNSLFTLGLMIGISVHETTLGTTVANLGMTEVLFPAPVFHGDTIHVKTEIMALRASASRPDTGIVTFRHQAFNQKGVKVASCDRQAMMLRRPTAKIAAATSAVQ